MIKVLIAGYRGRMGAAAVKMVQDTADFQLTALYDPHAAESEAFGIPVIKNPSALTAVYADVWIDFTTPSAVYENTKLALTHNMRPVIGTTGLTDAEISELKALTADKAIGGLIAPNFALGAVLLMQFSKQAAKYFPDVEIIELHHDQKKDAPSGTAVKTAEMIGEVREAHKQGATDEKETLAGSRGADIDGIRIHSVRLPGLIAHQEVLFGGVGEGLTLRHDSYDRVSFMTGVALAVRKVMTATELVVGLDNFID